MPTYKLNNLLIKIPFNPYPSQLSVITKLTHTLLNNQTCLIESPTGTGKSISIIASIMPFLELEDKKVYLCTRTHKQIRQMVMQIKQFFAKAEPVDKALLLSNQNSTENKPLLEESKPEIDIDKNLSSHKNLTNRNTVPPKMSILGSRNILCINEKINSQQDINSLCTDLVKNNKCKYFHNHPKAVKHFQNKLFDLEDLISYSKRTVSCPYFATKALSEKASLILSPYNYLVDPFIRKRLGISKAHIVIDEAHNIEDNLRESGSLQISVKEMIQYTNQIYSLKDKEILKLTELFTKLKQMYYKICLPEEGDVKRINENFNNQNENFNSQTENFNNLKNTNSQSSDTSTLFRYKDLINLVKEFFSLIEINNYKNIIYNLNDEIELECSRSVEVLLYILTNIITNNKYALNVERNLLNFILLDISELFNNLIKDNLSLTLLSGTIGDIKVFENDLKHNFSNKVISDHVVSKENLFVRKVLSYKNINLVGTLSVMNDLYFKNVSFMIEEYYSFTKGGVLVFFQSYSLLQKIKKFFKVNLFVEPTNSSDLDNVINKFKNEAQKSKALLLGVYRGKISEGIDFKDNYCRLVIAVSIPYPNLTDIVVKIKKENKLWYENQALKAVNQAVGRVIRHKDDYGGIILLDSRYKFKRLSQWIERSSKDCGFEESVKDYKEFVKNRTKK